MDIEVTPVAQHIAGVAQGGCELEVVIRPAQTLTPSYRGTEDGHGLIVVEHRFVVHVVGVVATVTVAVHRVVVVERVVTVVARDVTLLRVEGTDVEAVRTLATKPVGTVVGTQ